MRWLTLLLLLVVDVAECQKPPNILLLLADDWSSPYASVLGERAVKTPTFDKLAKDGALFLNAFCDAPSCTPSRASILTGMEVHRLQEGSQLWGSLPKRFETYPDALEGKGYFTGYERKGWGPGNVEVAGRTHNPAGKTFKNYQEFFRQRPKDKPFCYWFGSVDPHRPYDKGSGRRAGMDMSKVTVPPFLPDDTTIRSDLLDYFLEIERFDRECGEIIARLDSMGELENTIVVMTSDNGMPFPRGKATLYDAGTKMPLVIYWKGKIKAARYDQFVTLRELAPTFLRAAGLTPPKEAGEGLLTLLLKGRDKVDRSQAFLERERHSYSREGNLSYPARAVRNENFLYIRNLRSKRWPAGDPSHVFSVGAFGDIDASPTKEYLIAHKDNPLFAAAMAIRPAEELYDLKNDPAQLKNLAAVPAFQQQRQLLQKKLLDWMKRTGDPRATAETDVFDSYPYYGKRADP